MGIFLNALLQIKYIDWPEILILGFLFLLQPIEAEVWKLSKLQGSNLNNFTYRNILS